MHFPQELNATVSFGVVCWGTVGFLALLTWKGANGSYFQYYQNNEICTLSKGCPSL